MAAISTVRTAIATALGSVTGLRAYDHLVGNPEPNCAVVRFPETLDPHAAFGDIPDFVIPVDLLVKIANDRSGDDALEAFLNTSGSSSVIAAIEAIGSAYRVTGVRDIGVIALGETPALAATIDVRVLA